MVGCSPTNKVVVGSNPVSVTQTLDIVPVSSKEFLDIQVNLECRFTLRRVSDMIILKDSLYDLCHSMSTNLPQGVPNLFAVHIL